MGRDKLSLIYGGRSLLESAVDRFNERFDRVVVSVSDLTRYPDIRAERIADIYKDAGPMSGLHAALKHTGDDVFLTAADMPFSSPAAALRIIELCDRYDISVMTDKDGRYEPLFACYKKSVLPYAEEALSKGKNSMLNLFDSARVRIITSAELGGLWSEKLLMNINKPSDYEKLCLELNN